MARSNPLAETIAAIAAVQSATEVVVPAEGVSIAELQRLADFLGALGHVTRLRMVLYLRDGEESPKGMATRFGLPVGQVAHHARVLAKAGMIRESRTRARRGATEHFYVVTRACLDILETLGLDQTDRIRPDQRHADDS